jgi:hypothetical protein
MAAYVKAGATLSIEMHRTDGTKVTRQAYLMRFAGPESPHLRRGEAEVTWADMTTEIVKIGDIPVRQR